MGLPEKQGLYDPRNEHDSCGVGFVADIKGRKTHDIVRQGLQILVNLDHRGAVGADPLMGDGAGAMIQIPDGLLRDWARKEGVDLPEPGHYAVAMCFLPQDEKARAFAVKRFEHFVKVEKQKLVGWRDVPTDLTGLGKSVIEKMPVIRMAIVGRGPKLADQDAFERKILAIRKQTQNPLADLEKKHKLPGLAQLYMPSFSSRTVVYKGLLLAPQVESFYADLRNPLCESALCLVHQRFSTNTFPSWKLAHPYRFIAHNGEINTVRGNVNWMYARRDVRWSRTSIGADLDKMWPIIPARPVRHRLPRQRARAAGGRRLFAEPRHDDADPGGVGRQSADGWQAQGLLRIPRGADGAVGRPGLDRLHRRPPDRRHARPQRPAARALPHHRGRSSS